jgi:hypothetical protein
VASRPVALHAISAFAFLATLGVGPTLASDAPSWMHAQVTVPLPAHDDKTAAVMLYAETILSVEPDRRFKRTERRVYKILRPEGAAYGIVRVDFNARVRITDLHAWCIPTDGKDYEVKEKDAVESGLIGVAGGELMTDIRSKLLRIPAAKPGSIVGFEFALESRPEVMADEWDFQRTVPVREAHFTLKLPAGWSYKSVWLNFDEAAPTAQGPGQWHWVVSDVKAVKLQAQMPPWQGIAGKLVIPLSPPDAQGHGFTSWNDIASWFLNLARDRRDASPEIRRKVDELTASEATVLGKIQALARFVQEDIRYVGIELGVGAYQPRPAAEVLAHRYGDCKDKATLLSSMLKEIGVDSYYVIINTQRGSIGATTPPNLGFNHAILAIQLAEGVHDTTLLAVGERPKLGRILFFDPTNPFTPLGRLAGALQANYGLLVTPDGGELVQLPRLSPESSGLQRTGQLTLDNQGTLVGDVDEVRVGDAADIQRAAMRGIARDTDQIRPIERLVAASMANFEITKAGVGNLRVIDKPLRYHYTIEAEKYAKPTGDLLLVRPRIVGSHASALLETDEPREQAVEFNGPERDSDEIDIQIPPGYVVDDLPPAVNVDYGFASYRSKTELKGRSLHYTRVVTVSEVSVPVSKAEELKKFYRIIYADERMSAVLRHVAP